jgi:hypothetical protein
MGDSARSSDAGSGWALATFSLAGLLLGWSVVRGATWTRALIDQELVAQEWLGSAPVFGLLGGGLLLGGGIASILYIVRRGTLGLLGCFGLMAMFVAGCAWLSAGMVGIGHIASLRLREPLIDEALGFRLDPPNGSALTFGRDLARSYGEGVVGAIADENWCPWMSVVPQATELSDSEAWRAHIAGTWALDGAWTTRKVHDRERQVHRALDEEDRVTRIEVLLGEGTGWMLYGVGCSDEPHADLQPWFDAFRLLSSAKVEVPVPVIADRRGRGWSIEEGVFRSLSWRFDVPFPPGWTPMLGSALAELSAEDEVGFQQPELGIIVLLDIGSDPDSTDVLDHGLRAWLDAIDLSTDRSMELRLFDEPITMRAWREDDAPWQRWQGRAAIETLGWWLWVRAPASSSSETVRIALQELLSGFVVPEHGPWLERLSAAGVSVDRSIETAPPWYRNGGRVAAPSLGILWVAPDDLWRIDLGPRAVAATSSPEFAVVATNPNVQALLWLGVTDAVAKDFPTAREEWLEKHLSTILHDPDITRQDVRDGDELRTRLESPHRLWLSRTRLLPTGGSVFLIVSGPRGYEADLVAAFDGLSTLPEGSEIRTVYRGDGGVRAVHDRLLGVRLVSPSAGYFILPKVSADPGGEVSLSGRGASSQLQFLALTQMDFSDVRARRDVRMRIRRDVSSKAAPVVHAPVDIAGEMWEAESFRTWIDQRQVFYLERGDHTLVIYGEEAGSLARVAELANDLVTFTEPLTWP